MQKLNCLAVLLVLITASACQRQSAPAAPESQLPSAATAVGPIPGAGAGQRINFRTNPFAGDSVAIAEGWKLFNWYNCSGCHGGHAGGGMGPSLRDQVWLFGDRDDQIFDSIAEGRGQGMPSWGSKIPEEQIWKLVAYIKSMRTAQEPDAPQMAEHEQVAQTTINHPKQAGR